DESGAAHPDELLRTNCLNREESRWAGCPSADGSGLVDALLQSVLDVALDLLGLALALLDLAFLAHALVAGGFTHALFDVAYRLVAHAAGFIACAAHGKSPTLMGSEQWIGGAGKGFIH